MAVQIKVRLQSVCQSESVYCNVNRTMPRLCAPTFSRSWRSCLPLASLEHRFCSGATTVQMQRPSASWVELYTCHPSFGRMVCIQEHRHSCEYKGHMPTGRHAQQFPPRRCHSHEIAALNCYVFSFLSLWFITSSAPVTPTQNHSTDLSEHAAAAGRLHYISGHWISYQTRNRVFLGFFSQGLHRTSCRAMQIKLICGCFSHFLVQWICSTAPARKA